MTDSYARDRNALSALQELRFFPQSVQGGHGARLTSKPDWLRYVTPNEAEEAFYASLNPDKKAA